MPSSCSKLYYRKRSIEDQIKTKLKKKKTQAQQLLNLAGQSGPTGYNAKPTQQTSILGSLVLFYALLSPVNSSHAAVEPKTHGHVTDDTCDDIWSCELRLLASTLYEI